MSTALLIIDVFVLVYASREFERGLMSRNAEQAGWGLAFVILAALAIGGTVYAHTTRNIDVKVRYTTTTTKTVDA